MKRAVAVLVVALLGFSAQAADDAPAPKGMVLLTVGGLVGKPNRGAFDPKRDSALAHLKADFKHGFAFDREMLLALPQGTVKAKPIEFEKEATFKGPVLREVLHLIEAAMVKTTFVASDGYSGYLLPQDIKASDYILALEVDGKPLGLGQQGPLWLMNTRKEGETVGKDNRGSHVWALVYMHIGE
ncbi:MAG: molybdopterin-dependent oxidoreductase [Alphaproteobacteria bacterium]|jgi:hypothetical protein|uniref:hypothetical protein n=1 Tax=Methyloceanibacter sp. TaxID=1965321 RepID=UPI003567D2DD